MLEFFIFPKKICILSLKCLELPNLVRNVMKNSYRIQITTAPGRPKKLQWYFNVLLLLLFFSGFWYELSGWACSLHAAFWLNRSSLLVLILEQQNSTNQKKTGQNGERIVRTFHVNIFSHLFRPKLLWKTNLKRIKSYRIYISSNSRPEQVTEVIFIKIYEKKIAYSFTS